MKRFTLVLVVIGMATGPNYAAGILQDDFTGPAGTTVDKKKWATDTNAVPLLTIHALPAQLDGAGHVVIDPNTSRALVALPTHFASPTNSTGNEIKLTVHFTTDFTSAGAFGLTDGDGHGVSMSSAIAQNVLWFHVAAMDGTQRMYTFGSGIPTAGSAGTWVFTWTPGRIVVVKDGTTLIDTGTTVSDNPDPNTPFSIPTVAMGPVVFRTTLDGVWPGTALVDSVAFKNAAK